MTDLNEDNFKKCGPEYVASEFLASAARLEHAPDLDPSLVSTALFEQKVYKDGLMVEVYKSLCQQWEDLEEIVDFLRRRNASNESIRQMFALQLRVGSDLDKLKLAIESAASYDEAANGC